MLITIIMPITASASRPERIVSLKPNITELLFAIGAGDQLVGVTTWCDRPEAAKKLPKVADYIKPNVEKILSLKPDLIVASKENSVKAPFKVLEDANIKILYLKFKSIDDLIASTEELAKKTGHEEEGNKIINEIMSLQAHPRTVRPELVKGRKVLILVGKRPLVAAGNKTFLSEMVELAGGKNIIESSVHYPHVSMETLIVKKPDVIIDFTMGSELKSSELGITGNIQNLNISDFRLGPNVVKQVKELKEVIFSKR